MAKLICEIKLIFKTRFTNKEFKKYFEKKTIYDYVILT